MSNYRIIIRGVQAGQAVDQVALALARYSKKTPETLQSLLRNPKGMLAKRTQDAQSALRYKQMLEKMGCACLIEAEITQPVKEVADNAAITSLTGLTMSTSNAAPVARDYQYRKTPIKMRFQELMRIFRLKELVGIVIVVAVFYYGRANGFF